MPDTRRALLAGVAALPLLAAGCGKSDGIPASLLAQARPIGAQVRFHPPTPNQAVPRCAPALGARDAAHVELFAADRVVLMPAGIGTRHAQIVLEVGPPVPPHSSFTFPRGY